ncbi:imidazolonepropionase [Marinoscillum furvescens]|uniref:Imidazolonepropionase n=1 Tax=Marinoscillum furvescens DSM 4134 TaxID=1122208 RepID=A0A3D9L3P2_MARFU|nr:imidazolonepropionase [Marinoscillum furvescens]RED99863.1 imidazolonepropionase [Marinoscillum furvescens DSM 4134]
MTHPKLIGPITQLVALPDMPLKGALANDQLTIISQAGIVVKDGLIVAIGPYDTFNTEDYQLEVLTEDSVVIPGMIDAHTHLIWAGSRAGDYSLRTEGKSYQDILAAGGGIFDSVSKTQEATSEELRKNVLIRASRHLRDGITTIEVKTGYGLEVAKELELLKIIRQARAEAVADLVPTCLAAHVCPKRFAPEEFLAHLEAELLPKLLVSGLANRIDIFVEENAFPPAVARPYLAAAKKLGFDLTIHADQFTVGGSELAVEFGARSADHLEASQDREIALLASADVIPVALPGASLGLGMQFTPARKLLDAGASLAIATDWNPGSAPMGDLLVQAALLGAYEKLSAAELLAGVTYRAAAALGLADRGRLAVGERADFSAFPLTDFREIFYNQGKVKPEMVWKAGNKV